jgi:hypothetical protein
MPSGGLDSFDMILRFLSVVLLPIVALFGQGIMRRLRSVELEVAKAVRPEICAARMDLVLKEIKPTIEGVKRLLDNGRFQELSDRVLLLESKMESFEKQKTT